MFDVGFWEVMLTGLVALLVFGPERLPRLARETSLWMRKVRSVVGTAKTDIDRELQLYELRQTMEAKRQQFAKEVQSLTYDVAELRRELDVSPTTEIRSKEQEDEPK